MLLRARLLTRCVPVASHADARQVPVVGPLPHAVPDGAVPGQPGAGASAQSACLRSARRAHFTLPAWHQAAYCLRYSPYPRFMSNLLLWYMCSLLFLFGVLPLLRPDAGVRADAFPLLRTPQAPSTTASTWRRRRAPPPRAARSGNERSAAVLQARCSHHTRLRLTLFRCCRAPRPAPARARTPPPPRPARPAR